MQCGVLLLGALISTPLPATALSDVAAALQPGQWAELATEGFNQATLGDGDSYSVFWYAEDLAWEEAHRQLLYVGGGHGSDAEFLTYDEASNRWSVRKPGGAIPWDDNFSHAYDQLALIPALGRLYFRQPAFSPSDRLEIYHIATASWSRSAPMPRLPACCGALEYFPELGGLVMVAGAGPIYLYEAATDAWSTLSNGTAVGSYHNFAEYSPVHRAMLFGGGEEANGAALYLLRADRQITRLNDAPSRMGTTHSVVSTDPVTGHFLVFFNSAAYELDPRSQAWAALPAPPWLAHGEPGVFNVVATPIPTYGVILVAKYAGDNSRVYVYRHAARAGPTPTLELTANPLTLAPGGFTVLSWITTDVTQCTATAGTAGWPGTKNVPNGSESVGPVQSVTTFGLSCSGPGGAVQRSVTIDVQPVPPPGGGAAGSNRGGGGGSLGLWCLLNLLGAVAMRSIMNRAL